VKVEVYSELVSCVGHLELRLVSNHAHVHDS
jgi:hypothetical protein